MLGSPKQDKHEHTGETPAKGHNNDEGTGKSHTLGKSERAGTDQSKEEMDLGISYQCNQDKYLMKGNEEYRTTLLLGCSVAEEAVMDKH